MKAIQKTTRQNLILVVLAVTFFFISKAGVDAFNADPDSIGLMLIGLGGLPFLGTTIALIVRLWDMD